jgi:glycosyltransferase involved in cell wall biosynthesis
MKVAIVHYWLVNWRGGEKVIESLLELYPNADIFTHIYDEKLTEHKLKDANIYQTFISRLPGAKKHYQKYLPLMPLALEQLDLRDYDLVISSESGPAKGVVTRPDAVHICYCHSPMRYVWDMYPDYMSSTGRISRAALFFVSHYLKIWDRLSADRVDYFIANSAFVASRIKKFYRRESTVINPPIDISEFRLEGDKEDFYLVLGQLTPYKKASLVVDAFKESGRKLVVIGDGEEYTTIIKNCPDNVSVLGRVDWNTCKEYLAKSKALIFPGIEDFGMVPVEAIASGTPVLAYAKGGALETVIDGCTGHFFTQQSVESINECVNYFEVHGVQYTSNQMRDAARDFSKENFLKKIKSYVEAKIEGERI